MRIIVIGLTIFFSSATLVPFQIIQTQQASSQRARQVCPYDRRVWAKTYGTVDGNPLYDMTKISNDYVILTTSTTGQGDPPPIIIKINSSGNVKWSYQTIVYSGYFAGSSLKSTNDGGYIIAGKTVYQGASRIAVVKLDSNGNTVEWAKVYANPLANSNYMAKIITTIDGGYLITARDSYSYVPTYDDDIWILKLDIDGNIEWQKAYGDGQKQLRPLCVQQTADGGYVVGAMFSEPYDSGNNEILVLKVTGTGVIEWEKVYQTLSSDFIFQIRQTSDYGYIIAGDTPSFGSGNMDGWLIKLDHNGNVQWEKAYGGESYDRITDIIQDGSSYIIVGYTGSFGAGESDIWIMKLEGNGEIQWQKTCGSSWNDQAMKVYKTGCNQYIIAGHTNSFGAGYYDVWVIKFTKNGDFSNNNGVVVQDSNASVVNTNATVVSTSLITTDTAADVTNKNISMTECDIIVNQQIP